jgi:hypothetical protein
LKTFFCAREPVMVTTHSWVNSPLLMITFRRHLSSLETRIPMIDEAYPCHDCRVSQLHLHLCRSHRIGQSEQTCETLNLIEIVAIAIEQTLSDGLGSKQHGPRASRKYTDVISQLRLWPVSRHIRYSTQPLALPLLAEPDTDRFTAILQV